jgi:hypothetical protein
MALRMQDGGATCIPRTVGEPPFGARRVQIHHVGIEDPGEAAPEAPPPAARVGVAVAMRVFFVVILAALPHD